MVTSYRGKFEWEEEKRLWTLQDRGLDFVRARAIFDGRTVLHIPTKRGDEERFASIAIMDGKYFTVI